MEARIAWTIARTMITAKSGYGKQWPPPNPAMAEGCWRKVEENGRRRKRYCWTLTEKREREREILYISIYLYVSACKRERDLPTPPHETAQEDIVKRGKMGKTEMNLLWFCDNNGNDCASKELWSFLCGENKTHFLFSSFVFVF